MGEGEIVLPSGPLLFSSSVLMFKTPRTPPLWTPLWGLTHISKPKKSSLPSVSVHLHKILTPPSYFFHQTLTKPDFTHGNSCHPTLPAVPLATLGKFPSLSECSDWAQHMPKDYVPLQPVLRPSSSQNSRYEGWSWRLLPEATSTVEWWYERPHGIFSGAAQSAGDKDADDDNCHSALTTLICPSQRAVSKWASGNGVPLGCLDPLSRVHSSQHFESCIRTKKAHYIVQKTRRVHCVWRLELFRKKYFKYFNQDDFNHKLSSCQQFLKK